MKTFLVVVLFLHSTFLIAQDAPGGSFFIVASGADGIMVASDSRTQVYNKSRNTIYGYHDFGIKTFTVGNTAMVVLGHEVFDGKYLHAIFEDYKKGLVSLPKPSELLSQFFGYCSNKLPVKDYNLLIKNRYLVCGYENSKPLVCMQDGSISKRECVNEDWVRIASDASEFEINYAPALTCMQLSKIAEKAIYTYATKYNAELEIGGPVRILQLTLNDIRWLQHKPASEWRTVEEHYKDYISGKTPLIFFPKENKEKFT